jgi:protein-S-isoprenylcysteine O-methyltransferase Ste14
MTLTDSGYILYTLKKVLLSLLNLLVCEAFHVCRFILSCSRVCFSEEQYDGHGNSSRFLIPVLVEVHFEDSELVRRSGDEHRHYIKNTGALFPHRDVAGFFKLLFLGKDDSPL